MKETGRTVFEAVEEMDKAGKADKAGNADRTEKIGETEKSDRSQKIDVTENADDTIRRSQEYHTSAEISERSLPERELAGKVALVTGAGRGIGRAIACILADMGAAVLVNYNGSGERARKVVEEIRAAGGRGEAIGCDVSDYSACGRMTEEIIRKYGHVDILVNNAGITRDNLILRMTEEDYDRVLDTNLKGAFNTIRHLSRYFLKQRSGRIINISSVSGVVGNAGQANYAASKAGLIGLTKSVAKELAPKGIRVNAVAPGFIRTEMTEGLSEKAKEMLLSSIPAGRMGNAEDVARTVAFLAGKGAEYITGQVICVDGGMTCA